MFYRKDWISDPEEQKRYADRYGITLKVPDTWEELDQQLAFFHRPESGRYGGALFRSQYFIAWEWWVRFHAKGFFPFTDDLAPQINNDAGVKALEELAAASKYLYPGARSNGLFENFEAYGKGDSYANIGWGGTQALTKRRTCRNCAARCSAISARGAMLQSSPRQDDASRRSRPIRTPSGPTTRRSSSA